MSGWAFWRRDGGLASSDERPFRRRVACAEAPSGGQVFFERVKGKVSVLDCYKGMRKNPTLCKARVKTV